MRADRFASRVFESDRSQLDLLETPLAFAAIDGAIQIANRAFRTWCGNDAAALQDAIGLDLDAALAVLARGKPYAVKATGRAPRGRPIPVEYHVRLAVYDGEEVLVVEGRDLSRVLEKEAMLQAFASTIEVNNRLLATQKSEIAQLYDDVKDAYAAVQHLLDTADQGFVTLDRSACLLASRSAAFDRWFGTPPPGTPFAACLERMNRDVAAMFELLWGQLALEVLPLDALLEMLPPDMAAGARRFRLSYRPSCDDRGGLINLLVVITEITAEVERERAEAQQIELSNLLARFASDRAGFVQFVAEADALIAAITAPEVGPQALFRAVHTLKGNCALFGAQVIARLCHDLEDHLAEGADASVDGERRALGESWRALRQRISVFLEHGGDGVWIARDELEDLRRRLPSLAPEDLLRTLDSWTWESATRRLARLGAQARELAARLSRGAVDIVIDGGGLRFEPARWNPFWLSLVHLVLNSVDHGIEPAAQRLATGKSARAQLSLRTALEGDHVIVEIRDDGRGIDWHAVARAAAERGLDTDSSDALVRSLFVDGVTTRGEVDARSGRGVGLAAVRAACERLAGTIAVDSAPGVGTTFRFRLPALGVAAAHDDEPAQRSVA